MLGKLYRRRCLLLLGCDLGGPGLLLLAVLVDRLALRHHWGEYLRDCLQDDVLRRPWDLRGNILRSDINSCPYSDCDVTFGSCNMRTSVGRPMSSLVRSTTPTHDRIISRTAARAAFQRGASSVESLSTSVKGASCMKINNEYTVRIISSRTQHTAHIPRRASPRAV